MRTLVALVLASLLALSASASHAPRPECHDTGLPATGAASFGADGKTFYVVDDADGDTTPHVYEETNGIAGVNDPAHALQREEGHAGHAHPDLPAGCGDPLVVPDTHHV